MAQVSVPIDFRVAEKSNRMPILYHVGDDENLWMHPSLFGLPGHIGAHRKFAEIAAEAHQVAVAQGLVPDNDDAVFQPSVLNGIDRCRI